ncbi:hypothetical protein [Roseivirga pacifica]|uniref:hypothetical protein n=1 Tax=Roseivirga pacifica TaxID=1267423 RepID=UPI003BAE3ABE
MSTNVSTPMMVVNIPTFFDLVQPDMEIMAQMEKSPTKKVDTPSILGTWKSFNEILSRYPPGVVAITMSTIAKTHTRKQPEDKVADFKIRFVNLLLLSDTNRLATTVIENPLRSELINRICFANSFQYSMVISISLFGLINGNVIDECSTSRK